MQPPTTVAIETSEEEEEEEPEEADEEKDERDGLPFFTGDCLEKESHEVRETNHFLLSIHVFLY